MGQIHLSLIAMNFHLKRCTAETIRNYFEKLDLLPINNYTAVVIEMGIFESFKMISSRGVK